MDKTKMKNNEEHSEYRSWEYARLGEYHRKLDLNWSYAPTYLRKMSLVRKFLDTCLPSTRILDAGCGEGVLVEEYSAKGYQIEGVDQNYGSTYVRQGDIREMSFFDNNTFDVVLLLDVFEHLGFYDQQRVLQEIKRILKPNGYLIASIPNLGHLSSRIAFVLFGRLFRTDIDLNHIGERPYFENRRLLAKNGFVVERVVGITLTVPLIYGLITRHAARLRWLHNLFEPLAIPSLAMLDMFYCRARDSKAQ
jgi:2-polyprenyl-3-methyl-5-hydroxy-6-metoxy-1,4-benzoquinol methylase